MIMDLIKHTLISLKVFPGRDFQELQGRARGKAKRASGDPLADSRSPGPPGLLSGYSPGLPGIPSCEVFSRR